MKLLQMSLAGGVMILVITVIRALAIERLPKKTFLALWAVVIVRLLLPFSIPSVFSIYSWIGRKAVGTGESTANVIAVPVRNMGQLVAASHPSSEAATTVPETRHNKRKVTPRRRPVFRVSAPGGTLSVLCFHFVG